MTFEVNIKTGFEIVDPFSPVVINDFRGIQFYTNEDVLPSVKRINLPPFGTFTIVKGVIHKLQNPVNYELQKLQPIQHVYEDPSQFDIVFGNNPHKCTVNFDTRVIFFDNSFRSKTLPVFYFVLYHEYAHRFYGYHVKNPKLITYEERAKIIYSEKCTDALAYNYMLIKGFNPEQIGRAQTEGLSDNQYNRKLATIERVLQQKVV